jgi:peptide-methionine (S)-S-oxide reductase
MISFVLGGGCFWCLDAVYRRIRGVTKVESGYAGGDETTAHYYDVVSGTTNHAEVVRVTFDDSIVPAETILAIFFLIHNPTSLNRQGADEGPQYRLAMFYENQAQKNTFEKSIANAEKLWDNPIVTEITPLQKFYLAEDEHQDYFSKHPEAGYCQFVIEPKVTKARQTYTKWFKEENS